MRIIKSDLNIEVLNEIVSLSKLWEEENCSYGVIETKLEDIKEPLIIASNDDNEIIGYIYGHYYQKETKSSIIDKDELCFEVDELFVKKEYRSNGIGKALFLRLQDEVSSKAKYITLLTSTKNYKSILHFYIDELGMDFYTATLVKKV